MKVRDITTEIEAFAPLSNQEVWDNSGLCIGSQDDEVHGVLLGLDCTPELVDEAVRRGCDMIVTHHPLIFGGLKKINREDPVGEAVMKAISKGIAVYASHTAADKVPDGVSGAMASRLNLLNQRILDEDRPGSGLGIVGDLPGDMESEDFVALVKKQFNLKVVKCSHPLDGPIRTVAVCGGSGSSLIEQAMASGAQAYVTGDVTYHHFFTGKDFMILDIGHYESEREIVDVLFSLLTKKFPNFAVRVSENINSNPIFYF